MKHGKTKQLEKGQMWESSLSWPGVSRSTCITTEAKQAGRMGRPAHLAKTVKSLHPCLTAVARKQTWQNQTTGTGANMGRFSELARPCVSSSLLGKCITTEAKQEGRMGHPAHRTLAKTVKCLQPCLSCLQCCECCVITHTMCYNADLISKSGAVSLAPTDSQQSTVYQLNTNDLQGIGQPQSH
jgi:hypothetical protein